MILSCLVSCGVSMDSWIELMIVLCSFFRLFCGFLSSEFWKLVDVSFVCLKLVLWICDFVNCILCSWMLLRFVLLSM